MLDVPPPIARRLVPALALLLGSAGCGDDDAPAPVDGGTDATMDAAGPDAFVAPDAGSPPDVCDELGLPRAARMEGSATAAFGEVAGDFTVETLDGEVSLADLWTGCESYVFIAYVPAPAGDALWTTFPDPLLARSRPNVHYFFASYETVVTAAIARVEAMRTSIEEALRMLGPEDAEHWRERIHYVSEPLGEVTGSVGELVRNEPSPMLAFGIDRAQRFDPVGSLMRVVSSGFVPRLGMAAYASHWYDYRAELEARIAAETDTTVVPLVSETDFSTRVFDREATLPDAAAMSAFDTLEVDVEIVCRRQPGDCSEWDRIARIELCEDAGCTTRRELARWITPYARPGSRRWLIDASPFLGLLRDGGARTFRVTLGPDWEEATERDVEISLRLSDRGTGLRATGGELAFVGGPFDATYDEAHPPFHFTPPDGTTRVELVVIVSGHGQTDGDNCAEWCNHEHTFQLDGGTPHRIDFPGEAGRPLGCADRAGEGVVPGQYGNWAPSRAGWCPGLPVEAVRIDLTAEATIGADNELTYVASFMDGDPRGGNIALSAYVVYYGD